MPLLLGFISPSPMHNNPTHGFEMKTSTNICYLDFDFNFNGSPWVSEVRPMLSLVKRHGISSGISYRPPRVIASCRGVLCVSIDGYPTEGNWIEYRIYLFNPSINEIRQVRCFTVDRMDAGSDKILYGFGFAHRSDDFKLVIIREALVEVYSLKTNTWASIRPNPSIAVTFLPRLDAIYFNGACHWLMHMGTEEAGILTFDLDMEEFGYIILPEPCSTMVSSESRNVLGLMQLFVYNDMLALCSLKEEELGTESVTLSWNLWVMKEYGVHDSWTPLMNVDQSPLTMRFPAQTWALIHGAPRVLENDLDGRIVLHWHAHTKKDTYLMIAADPWKEQPYIHELPHIFRLVPYVRSLFMTR